ncbi:MAG: tRNA pseudouridine(38-40) synthase TruA [Spongiibacteraceae bacterium]|nr:tRNA pseudouridine(38-40) synthase TruA [Spongiibacteraceae bacterium]
MRYRLIVEYDGGPFVGWQRQVNGMSVQQALEEAVLAYAGEKITVFSAGRTDAGVHATGQVAHLDLSRGDKPDKVQAALNAHLRPHPIAVTFAAVAEPDFHARFSAIGRAYLYRILNRRAAPALEAGRVWWLPGKLDPALMQAGADRLIGDHDFTSFRATYCQAKSPLKTIDRFEIRQAGEEIHCIVEARSFLHHQVRNMVGTLRKVGEGKWTPDDVTAALDARARAAAGETAPADGLYLTRVDYPSV